MSDISRLETLVRLGLRHNSGERLTDTEFECWFNSSAQEETCERLITESLTMFCPIKGNQPKGAISTWYQQSADFQDITRILNGLLSRKEESDG